jgi:hypothetical protein
MTGPVDDFGRTPRGTSFPLKGGVSLGLLRKISITRDRIHPLSDEYPTLLWLLSLLLSGIVAIEGKRR